MTTIYHNPPSICDVCGGSIGKGFVDGATRRGPWAIMCAERCYPAHGVGLGTGKGQKYERQEDGTFKKVQG